MIFIVGEGRKVGRKEERKKYIEREKRSREGGRARTPLLSRGNYSIRSPGQDEAFVQEGSWSSSWVVGRESTAINTIIT